MEMAVHYLTKCFGREEKGEGWVDNPYCRLAAPFVSSGGLKRFSSSLLYDSLNKFSFPLCQLRN